MSQDSKVEFLRSLPKCEHHMHVEGALTPELLFTLAKNNSVALPSDDPAFASPATLKDRYTRFDCLDDFLHYYYIGMSVLITAADFEALAWDYFQHAAADGVVHAEIFFDPQAHLGRGVRYDTLLAGFQAARRRAAQELQLTSELICCFLRHLPAADCLSTFELAEVQAGFERGDVVGIGLDSSELDFPPELFEELYRRAGEKGLKLTAHAGEEGPSGYIETALDRLGVSRIDHGIRLADDDALLDRIVAQETMLSVCPWSNLLLRCTDDIAKLPIRKFLDKGVRFSINSDDPAYFGNHYILDNYVAVQDAFDLSVEEWRKICAAGIDGSWCSAERKTEMFRILDAAIAKQQAKQ
ncbi:adenine deaminase Dea2 [Polychaeton citri CBS 116435]|uniref:Adenine deaminase n=1 Tax=Polychaeton citri CBS 116435 TaxID=1314669 RepID=A0A9P4Q783_9PEZI|nr:adenine deaminase Dea2 [Polychaeton citri CBS 116435]